MKYPLSIIFPVKTGKIESFYYGISDSSVMYSGCSYALMRESDGTLTAEYKPHGLPEEQALKMKVSEDTAKKLCDILKGYKTGRWHGFDKSNPNVMDGTGFSLDVTFTDGSEIKAHGYMCPPKRCGDFSGAVSALYNKIYDRVKY